MTFTELACILAGEAWIPRRPCLRSPALHTFFLRFASPDVACAFPPSLLYPKGGGVEGLKDNSVAKVGGAEQVLTNGNGNIDGPRAVGSFNGENHDEGEGNTEGTDEKVKNNQDPSHVAKGSPSTADAKTTPSQTSLIPPRSGEDTNSSMSVRDGEEGTQGPGVSMDRRKAPAGSTIPKLKISIKPPSLRALKAEETGLGRLGEGTAAGAGAPEGPGRVGKSRSLGSLKLVLKRPTALTSAASSLSSLKTANTVGGNSGVDRDGLGQKRSRRPTEKARWKQEEEEDFKSVFGSSSSSDEAEDDSDVGEGGGGGAAANKEDEEEWTGESRVGRGGKSKRRARPLGSRLKAIARLGVNSAAAGDSADDSADEYKPEMEVRALFFFVLYSIMFVVLKDRPPSSREVFSLDVCGNSVFRQERKR